jgi:hypothetical protein
MSSEYATTYYQLKGRSVEFNDYCIGMKAILEGRTLAYTVQPNPVRGRILYSSVFIKRRKVIHDKIDFGKYYD